MIKIKMVNDLGRQLITTLVKLIIANGGFVHSSLQLTVIAGEMSFSYHKKIAKGEPVITLPLSCMPILSDFDYSMRSGQLVAATKQNREVTQLHKSVMELCVELYNLFDKVENYSLYSAPVQLASHSQLCEVLLKATNAEMFSIKHLESLENLKVVCLWHNRAYFDIGSGTDRLIPILDLFDHHAFADGYRQGHSTEGGRTVELHFTPTKGSKNVYVSYAAMDALESFVKYGFVDRSAFFVQSQAFTVELPLIGEVRVNNLNINAHQLLVEDWSSQPTYRNSLFYASKIQFLADKPPEISYCAIPPKRHIKAFDEALHHQMSILENNAGLSVGALNNETTLHVFKTALVNKNKSFYSHLAKLAKSANLDKLAPTTIMLRDMLQHQIKIIKQYEKNIL